MKSSHMKVNSISSCAVHNQRTIIFLAYKKERDKSTPVTIKLLVFFHTIFSPRIIFGIVIKHRFHLLKYFSNPSFDTLA